MRCILILLLFVFISADVKAGNTPSKSKPGHSDQVPNPALSFNTHLYLMRLYQAPLKGQPIKWKTPKRFAKEFSHQVFKIVDGLFILNNDRCGRGSPILTIRPKTLQSPDVFVLAIEHLMMLVRLLHHRDLYDIDERTYFATTKQLQWISRHMWGHGHILNMIPMKTIHHYKELEAPDESSIQRMHEARGLIDPHELFDTEDSSTSYDTQEESSSCLTLSSSGEEDDDDDESYMETPIQDQPGYRALKTILHLLGTHVSGNSPHFWAEGGFYKVHTTPISICSMIELYCLKENQTFNSKQLAVLMFDLIKNSPRMVSMKHFQYLLPIIFDSDPDYFHPLPFRQRLHIAIMLWTEGHKDLLPLIEFLERTNREIARDPEAFMKTHGIRQEQRPLYAEIFPALRPE